MGQSGRHHGCVEFLLGDNCQLVDVELFSVDPQVGFGVAASAHCDSHVIFAILGTDRPRSHVRGDFLVRLENGFQQAFTCDSLANPGQVRADTRAAFIDLMALAAGGNT